ncbi:MAG: citrate lyase acyl carrier protein [Sphaerochaetaceae bacterium]
MKLHGTGIAGTLESGDALIEISPKDAGIQIELDSTVESQFGKYIRKIVLETCREFQLEDVLVRVHDKGALDCTLRARMTAAILRAGKGEIEYEF